MIFLHAQSCHETPFQFVTPKDLVIARSTSKTGALEDNETPSRLTSTTAAQTGGLVMFSGIKGALHITPTWYFGKPGLNVNGEEWIKVMDG